MSLRRNSLWNLAGTGLPLLIGAATIPYVIDQAGLESFGVLTLIWALIGYFSLFDFGLGRALTQQVAATRAAGDQTRLPGLMKTGLSFIAVSGFCGGVLLALIANSLATSWLNVSASLQEETWISLLITSIGIPLATATTGFRGILEAYEDFRGVNLLRMMLGAANFGLPALSIMLLGSSLIWMVASLILARIVVLLAHAWLVHRRVSKGWLHAKFNRKDIEQLLSFGGWMAISNIISPLMVTADRFVISAMLGASVVAHYTVPFEAIIRVLIVPGAITAALFPRLSAIVSADMIQSRAVYRRCLKTVAFILLPTCLTIVICSWWGLNLWLGKDFADSSWTIVCILALGVLFNGIAFVPFAAIQATGDARTTAYLHLVELALYVPALFTFLMLFGLVGAAAAWTVRVGIDLLALLIIASRRGF